MMNLADAVVPDDDIPLVAHLVYSFGCGGLQTLLAECINRIPAQHYRHAVICLVETKDYAERISRPDVTFYDLHKPPGNSPATHVNLWKLLRRLRPAVLHTYNVGTIEYNATALLANVPVRIHAEHGRDSVEIDGKHGRYNLLRRLLVPVIDAYVPVSDDLVDWLRHTIGIPEQKITKVINGVDTAQYAPAGAPLPGDAGAAAQPIWIGTVGRADRIKNHTGLLDVFERLLERFPAPQFDLRLAIIGDGPLLETLRHRVASTGWADRVHLPGACTDVAGILRGLSVFVLPSLSEATPVVILEAMATGLPVVASRVGGVPQLVLDGQTGLLADAADVDSFADALASYIRDPELRRKHGAAGRAHIQAGYSVDAMVAGYDALYTHHLARKKKRRVSRAAKPAFK
jgi:sugar transferase (PEP-CTERM/EpsH1 system associated)